MSLPVLRLRVAGFWSSVTSCASSEEEKLYGQAACELQSIPIVWYRKVKPKVNTKCSSAVDVVNSKSSAGTVEAPESRSPHQDTQDSNDSSIPFFLKRQMTFLRNSTTATGTADGKSDSNTSGINSNGSSDAGSSETYARFDGVLSLCDTESGPAIELRSTSKDVQQILETHDFSDFDQKLDAIVSNLFQGKATGYAEDDVGADAGKEGAFAAIERIIPLDIIDYAAQGGAWDWSNMLNVGSGQLDCGIKVYSSANNFQLVGSGKKVLLFDIANESKLKKDEAISYINALAKWNQSRLEYSSQVDDGTGPATSASTLTYAWC